MNREKIFFWRDERVLAISLQIVVLAGVAIVLTIFGRNLVNNFQQLGLKFGFDFLTNNASFDIADHMIDYEPTDNYYRALLVGLLNSLRVMIIGIILATLLGVIIGISKISANWLLRQIATVYIELFRNTPLLLQLFFWYFAVFLKLPKVNKAIVLPGPIFLSNRGLYIPWPLPTMQTGIALTLIIFSLILAIIIWRKQRELGNFLSLLGVICILSLIIGLDWQHPQFNSDSNSIKDGLNLSPEFATILLGLTFYTAAFIAEVVRAGIQSVNKGQWEAAKALGLKPGLVMRLVIFPQSLRLMIPPLTSEFLNLAKNSSLAIAIGYFDIYLIANTIANQTGRSLEMLLIVMGTYLIINLIIASLMNWFNRLVQIIT
ncbi:amino acid ABC transporter permease [Gloeocapsa sp. PCC 73106]|uniref:amino acid ABC transporter permease n=1 Tax=Gloeocapsa sp. PCC 73106 TaxID=102232 RepID=UPI0002AC1F6F|nr:amine acid ABC transporter, permease protein, 3-TM region, His/Glu/Gln/Arg/opine family [Gloeocapsa sp. PCC 73106]